MSSNKLIYMAYLLRLWVENDLDKGDDYENTPAWRASLEDVTTRERYGFEKLKDLFEFLERQTMPASQDHNADPLPQLE